MFYTSSFKLHACSKSSDEALDHCHPKWVWTCRNRRLLPYHTVELKLIDEGTHTVALTYQAFECSRKNQSFGAHRTSSNVARFSGNRGVHHLYLSDGCAEFIGINGIVPKCLGIYAGPKPRSQQKGPTQFSIQTIRFSWRRRKPVMQHDWYLRPYLSRVVRPSRPLAKGEWLRCSCLERGCKEHHGGYMSIEH